MKDKRMVSQKIAIGLVLALFGAPGMARSEGLGAISGGGTACDMDPCGEDRVYALAVDGNSYHSVTTQEGSYTIKDVPAGRYYVVAHSIGRDEDDVPTAVTAWTRWAECGKHESCRDHSPAIVIVDAGKTTSDVDVDDWSPDIHLPPGFMRRVVAAWAQSPSGAGTVEVAESQAPARSRELYRNPKYGAIAGRIEFGGDVGIPALRIYAFSIEGYEHPATSTANDERRYTLENVPPGQYYVVAYTEGDRVLASGWTRSAQCSENPNCAGDHTLLPVTVTAGNTTTGVNFVDWNARDGAFIPRPREPAQMEPAPRDADLAANRDCTAADDPMAEDACILMKAYWDASAVDCGTHADRADQEACHLKAQASADFALDARYRLTLRLLKQGPASCEPAWQALGKAQEAWLQYREQHCKFVGSIENTLESAKCLRRVSEERLRFMWSDATNGCPP